MTCLGSQLLRDGVEFEPTGPPLVSCSYQCVSTGPLPPQSEGSSSKPVPLLGMPFKGQGPWVASSRELCLTCHPHQPSWADAPSLAEALPMTDSLSLAHWTRSAPSHVSLRPLALCTLRPSLNNFHPWVAMSKLSVTSAKIFSLAVFVWAVFALLK